MVAGVVALILDANPYLMPQQVKDIIMQTAREDNYTQAIPTEGSPKWGAGKINAYAAVQLALITVGTNEIKQEKKIEIYPNPSSSVLSFKGDFIPNTIDLIDANGISVKKEILNGSTSIADLKAGTYFVRFLKEGKVYQEKIIKL
jgi:subtilisin family serine protease